MLTACFVEIFEYICIAITAKDIFIHVREVVSSHVELRAKNSKPMP